MLLKLSVLHRLSLCTVSFCKATCLFSLLSLAILSFSASSLNAEPLPLKACKDLREKHQKLLQLQAVQDMGKGFDWVKANSKPEEIQSIKLFIETEEQLKFRCPKLKKNKNKSKKKIIKPKRKPAELNNRPAPKSAVDKTRNKKLNPDNKNKKTTKKSPVKKKVTPKKKPQKPKTKPKKKTEKQPEPTLLDDLIATIQDAAAPLPEEKKQ